VTPVVDRLRSSYRNLIKVDVAENQALARAFGVAATPSFLLVEDGLIRQVRIGGLNETRLKQMLQAD